MPRWPHWPDSCMRILYHVNINCNVTGTSWCLSHVCVKGHQTHPQTRVKDNNPLARKRLFLWISEKSTGSWGPPAKLYNFKNGHILITATAIIWLKYCRYGKKKNNQSCNQSINQSIRPQEFYRARQRSPVLKFLDPPLNVSFQHGLWQRTSRPWNCKNLV